MVKSLHGGMPLRRADRHAGLQGGRKGRRGDFRQKAPALLLGRFDPIISGFESILGIKSLLIGFGLAEDAIHSPNESYGLEQFDRGVETIPLFYKYFAAEK